MSFDATIRSTPVLKTHAWSISLRYRAASRIAEGCDIRDLVSERAARIKKEVAADLVGNSAPRPLRWICVVYSPVRRTGELRESFRRQFRGK